MTTTNPSNRLASRAGLALIVAVIGALILTAALVDRGALDHFTSANPAAQFSLTGRFAPLPSRF